jgi:hypothetical protein
MVGVTSIARRLVPPGAPAAPEGFQRLEERMVAGLPHVIALSEDLRLVVVVPSGLAATWRDADPTAIVSESAPEVADSDPQVAVEPVGSSARAPARVFVIETTGGVLASVPLVAGLRRRLPDSAEAGVRIELAVIGWQIRAGSLRGPGDFGSRVELAWHAADRAADEFSAPVISERVLERLPSASGTKAQVDAG